MKLTPEQAARIAEICGWTKNINGYWDELELTISLDKVTWPGFGDILRACKERGLWFVIQNNNIFVDIHKVSCVTTADIPTAAALAVIQAMEDTHARHD